MLHLGVVPNGDPYAGPTHLGDTGRRPPMSCLAVKLPYSPGTGCCSTDLLKLVPPPACLPEGFAASRWAEIGMFECCSHQADEGSCTWCPTLLQGMNAPCCAFGGLTSLSTQELPLCNGACCGLGSQGCSVCLWMTPLVIASGIPAGFSCMAAFCALRQRQALVEAYKLTDDDTACTVFCCYPCALWKHHAFIHAMLHMTVSMSPKRQQNAKTVTFGGKTFMGLHPVSKPDDADDSEIDISLSGDNDSSDNSEPSPISFPKEKRKKSNCKKKKALTKKDDAGPN